MTDERDDLGLVQEGDTPNGALQDRVEAFEVRGQGLAAVLPRDPVDPARVGVELVTADHQPAALFAQVDQIVRVAHAGGFVRQFAARHGLQRDVLVIDGGGRDMDAGDGRHLRPPQAGGVDDDLGPDDALIGDGLGDFAMR